jgi:hypothetical protein
LGQDRNIYGAKQNDGKQPSGQALSHIHFFVHNAMNISAKLLRFDLGKWNYLE